MKINKKITILGVSFVLCSHLSFAQEVQGAKPSPISEVFQNVQTKNPTVDEPIAINPNQPIPIDNTAEDTGGFKNSLVNKVDEKMAKIDELERKMNEQQLQNQLNQSNMNFSNGGGSSGVNSLSVPVVMGTTIIEKGKITLSKEILAIDSTGNKFTLNEKNNNIIKSINSDYIVFKDSKDKFPVLISNALSNGEGNNLGGGVGAGISGFPNSMLEVPNSIKAKAENSHPVGSLRDTNVSNSLR